MRNLLRVVPLLTLLVLSRPVQAAPEFIAPTPECGSTIEVTAGELVSFTVAAVDSAEGDTLILILSATGVPAGATLTPALPDTANPVMTDFSWTTTEADVGDHILEFTAADTSGASISCALTVRVASVNQSPSCEDVQPSIAELWPPNHKFVNVNISGFTDPDGDPVTYEIVSVTQDEPVDAFEDDSTSCDARIQDGQIQVRAERLGSGNGRVYEIAFVASDGNGGTCEGTVRVCVPHDQGRHTTCIDDGQMYDSIALCEDGSEEDLPEESGNALSVSVGRSMQTAVELQYTLPEATNYAIDVYNVAGRRVASVERGWQPAGDHSTFWRTTGLTRGVYFVRLRTDGGSVSKHVYVGR